jgi:hypothetical protein
MPKGLGCWGIRGIDELTVEELAHLHQQVEGWMSQRAHEADRTRRRPWVMPPTHGPSGVRSDAAGSQKRPTVVQLKIPGF